VRTLMRSRWLL